VPLTRARRAIRGILSTRAARGKCARSGFDAATTQHSRFEQCSEVGCSKGAESAEFAQIKAASRNGHAAYTLDS
jgi:hypothetical protein